MLSIIAVKNMKATLVVACLMLVFVSSVLTTTLLKPATAAALAGSGFSAGHIIDDSVFTDSNAMTVQDIQNFLNAKVGTCDNNGSRASSHYNSATSSYYTDGQWASLNGQASTFTCINQYVENTSTLQNNFPNVSASVPGGISAAQIIYNAAQEYQINPEVILATLQKEQGLVSDYWPWLNEYQYAMGYSCPDSSGCSSTYADFYKQVDGATWQFRQYLTHPNNYNYTVGQDYIQYNPNTSCGGSVVTIQNQATAALYDYTPYQPDAAALGNLTGTGDSCSAYGNRNFWYDFNTWFGSSIGTALIEGSGPTVYLLNGTTIYGIPSAEMEYNYGLNNTQVTPVTDAYIQSLTNEGTLSTLFNPPNSTTVYLADGGRSFLIGSGDICTAWGFVCSSGVDQVSYNVANSMQYNGALQPLMSYNYTVYNMVGGVKHPFLSQAALQSSGFNISQATPIQSSYNAMQTPGSPIIEASGALVKFGNRNTIYYYIGGNYYVLQDFTTYANWFPNQSGYLDQTSSYASTGPPVTGTMSPFFQTAAGKKYLITNGSKVDITATASNWPTTYSSATLDSVVNAMPTIATDSSTTTYRNQNGGIFAISNGDKSVIISMNDFYGLGYSLNNTINVSSDLLNELPDGQMLIGESSVFKVTGSDSIYLRGPGQSVYYLQNENQLGQFDLTHIDPVMPVSQLTQYSTPKPLSSFISTDGTNTPKYVVGADGKLWNFSSTQATQWGISSPAVTNLTDNDGVLSSLYHANASLPSFANVNGTVYYASGGVVHPIATGATYTRLGGNSSNTFNATPDFLASVNIGSVM